MAKIQYINKAEELIAELNADVVPEKNQWVLIDGEEYHVYHIGHTIEDGQHIVTVFCWDPTDGWDGKTVARLMADTVHQTLFNQLRAEQQRQIEETGDTDIDLRAGDRHTFGVDGDLDLDLGDDE